MYILPKNDLEFSELCKQQMFRGRHQAIMTIKSYLWKHKNIDLETFVDLITKYNKKGWPDWD